MKKKIIIADDHDLIHIGIKNIFSGESKYSIVGHAYSGKEAIEKAIELNPDIIFMDISMPDGNGIYATQEILKKNPNIKIIALSQYDNNEYLSQMINSGCSGYLLKNSRKEEIFEALKTVFEGNKYMNPNMINKFFAYESKSKQSIEQKLTKRELEILKNIAKGKNNPEIADELNISIRTVETHRRNLMQKLKVNSVVELLRYATKFNLIEL